MRKVRSLTRATLLLVLLSATWGAGAQTQPPQPKNDPPRWRSALGRVSAESLRKHLAYIASDELEGRKTPSKGLDLAAEYIAKQFRAAGLEPAGDDRYFQTAKWTLSARAAASFRLSFPGGPTRHARTDGRRPEHRRLQSVGAGGRAVSERRAAAEG